jgi:hypothetical protein
LASSHDSKLVKPKAKEVRDEIPLRPCDEEELRQTYLRILKMVENGLASKKPDRMTLNVECMFTYKGRPITGNAIHIAALYRDNSRTDGPPEQDGARLMEILVKYFQANINDECIFDSHGAEGRMRALHLAAARGNVKTMELLFDLGAGVDQAVTLNGEKNLTALQEAVLFRQEQAVRLLIAMGTNVDALSVHGNTCLHACAKSGWHTGAKLLVEAEADLLITNRGQHPGDPGRTPLRLAVDLGRFPQTKLHLLARPHIDDLLMVAHCNSTAALALITDSSTSGESGEAVIHATWAKVFENVDNDIDCRHLLDMWVELMIRAPRVGVNLLDTVVCEPSVEDPSHHWLPARAKLSYTSDMRCWYNPHKDWKYYTDGTDHRGRFPAWHRKFCQGAYQSFRENNSIYEKTKRVVRTAKDKVEKITHLVMAELETANNDSGMGSW